MISLCRKWKVKQNRWVRRFEGNCVCFQKVWNTYNDERFKWFRISRESFNFILNWIAIPHINSETNPPHPIINVVCKYLRQFLGTSFGVATLSIYCNTDEEGGTWFISAKWTIPEFLEIVPGIELVLIIYVRYWGYHLTHDTTDEEPVLTRKRLGICLYRLNWSEYYHIIT